MQFTSTLTSKGQTTIPREIRKKLGLRPKQRIAYRLEGAHVVIESAGSGLLALGGKLKGAKPALDKPTERAAYRKALAKRYLAPQ